MALVHNHGSHHDCDQNLGNCPAQNHRNPRFCAGWNRDFLPGSTRDIFQGSFPSVNSNKGGDEPRVLHIDDLVQLSKDKMIEDSQDSLYHADPSFGNIEIINFKHLDDHSYCVCKPDDSSFRHTDVSSASISQPIVHSSAMDKLLEPLLENEDEEDIDCNPEIQEIRAWVTWFQQLKRVVASCARKYVVTKGTTKVVTNAQGKFRSLRLHRLKHCAYVPNWHKWQRRGTLRSSLNHPLPVRSPPHPLRNQFLTLMLNALLHEALLATLW